MDADDGRRSGFKMDLLRMNRHSGLKFGRQKPIRRQARDQQE
jgi:hypothetical protein